MPGKMRDFALEVHFSKWEFAARYNLTGSDAESLFMAALLDKATPQGRRAFEQLHLGYTQTFGAPSLRAEIANTYDTVGVDQVLCFAGANEGIFVAMQVLLDPDDHAIVIVPNYQSAETVPLSICAVSSVALDAGRDWALDIDRLRAALRPNTKLISVNFPNNPTGMIPPRETLDALVALCRERGIWLFSDEVYRLLELDDAKRIPQVVDLYERGLSLNVMSKAYGLPGLRIGWIACRDRETLVKLERCKHYLSICNSGPSEALAEIALQARAAILGRNRDILRRNVGVADRFFAKHAELFEWRAPDGGCVALVRYRGADGADAFTRRLVEEAGVLLMPSSIYASEIGAVPTDYFRIGLGRADAPAAIAALQDWLAARSPQ